MCAYTIRYEADRIASASRVSHSAATLHDLRNVMTAIGGYLPDIRADKLGVHGSLSLAALVDHAMVLCRRTRGFPERSRPETVDIGHLLGRLAPIIRGMLSRTARLRVSSVGCLQAELHRQPLEAVLLNLAANAARASGPTGTVEVTARATDSTIVIEVSNDGDRLDASILEAAFSRSANKPSRGLGLTIVRDNLAVLNASLEVSSGRGRTSFRIELDRSE